MRLKDATYESENVWPEMTFLDLYIHIGTYVSEAKNTFRKMIKYISGTYIGANFWLKTAQKFKKTYNLISKLHNTHVTRVKLQHGSKLHMYVIYAFCHKG